jgi:hypothetical protein
MASAIERVCPPAVLGPQDEKTTLATPQREKRPDEEVTSFACKVLQVYHALREFSYLYSDDSLPEEFIDNRHENTPRYERMQKGVNSLTGRVTKLAEVDARIQTLFDLMVKTVVKEDDGNEGLREIEAMVHELIGKEKIITDHPFLKHGVVCVKDDFTPDLIPKNLLTETDLKKMIELKDHLLHPEKGLVKIDGDTSFSTTINNDFEKLLTFAGGRKLARKLIRYGRGLVIEKGAIDIYHPTTNSITLTNKKALRYGCSASGVERVIHPSYFTLAHECIHFLHFMEGNYKSHVSCERPELWTNQEEKDTIGHHERGGGLTENTFIKRTFHLPRKYHIRPQDLESFDCSLENLILGYIHHNKDSHLIDFIKEGRLETEHIDHIVNYICEHNWVSSIAHELLSSSIGKKFIKDNENFKEILFYATRKNDITIVKRLLSEFSEELENMKLEEKAILIMDSLFTNLEISRLLHKNKFNIGARNVLSKGLESGNFPENIEELLSVYVKNKELLNISDEDLALFRKTPGLSAEIQQALTS